MPPTFFLPMVCRIIFRLIFHFLSFVLPLLYTFFPPFSLIFRVPLFLLPRCAFCFFPFAALKMFLHFAFLASHTIMSSSVFSLACVCFLLFLILSPLHILFPFKAALLFLTFSRFLLSFFLPPYT